MPVANMKRRTIRILVLARPLDVIDDEDRHHLLLALQLETQLFPERGEDIRGVVGGVRIEWEAGLTPWRELQRERVEALEARVVFHVAAGESAKREHERAEPHTSRDDGSRRHHH